MRFVVAVCAELVHIMWISQHYIIVNVRTYRNTNIYHTIMLLRTSWYLHLLGAKNFSVFNKFFLYTRLMQNSKRMN
jgi:hypothetical protein